MKYKKFKYLVLIPVALLIIDRCTLVDISPTAIFKSNELKEYPYLTDVAPTSSYEIKSVIDYGSITYDTLNNFFLGAEHKKIDAKGVITSVRLPETDYQDRYDRFYVPSQSHYILCGPRDSVVYDLSEKKFERKIAKIIDYSDEFSAMDWASLYHEADVVLYREAFKDIDDVMPVYLKVENDWVLFLQDRYDHYNTRDSFPEKYNKLIFLKDDKNQRYSYTNSEPIEELANGLHDDHVIDTVVDKPEEGITTVAFTKDYVFETGRLIIPLGPSSFVGTEYSKLEKEGEFFYFKTGMVQHALSKVQWSNLSYFSVPERFRKNTAVSFIAFDAYGNIDNHDDEGIYVVRPKL